MTCDWVVKGLIKQLEERLHIWPAQSSDPEIQIDLGPAAGWHQLWELFASANNSGDNFRGSMAERTFRRAT